MNNQSSNVISNDSTAGKNNFSLTKRELELVHNAIKQFSEIEKAIVFGSRARGNAKTFSDLDLAVFGKKVTSQIAASLVGYIHDETTLPYFVDVVVYSESLDKQVRKEIDEKGIVIFGE